MTTYKKSNGERVDKKTIDALIRQAKELKLRLMRDSYGYVFCEDCKISRGRMDCSHTISVKECQETGKAEQAWNIHNIKVRCRDCHQRHDKLL